MPQPAPPNPVLKTPGSPHSIPGSFDSDVRSAVQTLRRAISECLSATGTDASVPLQVSRDLAIDKSLAWKVCRIVTESDPALVSSRLPGKPGVKILGKALRRAGVDEAAVERLESAIAQFRDVQERHAGDREMFAAMLTGSAASRSSEEANRRQSFLGNSATWGVRAQVQVSVQCIAPSKTPGMVDQASAAGFIGFQRLRNEIPWSMANITLHDDQGRPLPATQFGPLDPSGLTADGVPLLPGFCSKPLPQMELTRSIGGRVRLQLGGGAVGRSGAMNIFTGGVMKGVLSKHRTPEDRYGSHNSLLSTPVELLIHDLFVHRSLGFAMNPKSVIYNQLPSGPIYPVDGLDAGVMRIGVEVEELGSPPDLTTPEFGGYPRLVEMMAKALGCAVDDLVGYRVRLKFPPIPALSALRHELAEIRT